MKHYLQYATAQQSGIWELDANSVSYLDVDSERLTLYKKPLDQNVPMILCARSTVFVVNEKQVEILKPLFPVTIRGVTLTLKPSDYALVPLYQKYKPLAIAAAKNKKNRPVFLAATVALLLFVVVSQFDFNKSRSGFDAGIHESQPDLSAQDIASRLIKMARQAIEQKKYSLAIEHIDKVLKTDPANPEAIKLKEEALQHENQGKLAEQKNLKKDIHIKTLIDKALSLMTKKDYEGALFHLEQVLEETPDDPEAKELYATLQENMKKADEEKQKQSSLQAKSADEAQILWKEGEALLAENNFDEAWAKLLKATAILDEGHLEPFYKAELNESLSKTEAELYNATQPLAKQAKSLQTDGDRLTGAKQTASYKNALGIYFDVKRKFFKYPLLDNEIALVSKKLNESLKQLYTEAQVTHDLEGCCKAKPLYIKVMEAAEFESIPYYAKSKEAVSQCVCR